MPSRDDHRPGAVLAMVGGGNMGTALAGGLLAEGVVEASGLVIVETDESKWTSLRERFAGVAVSATVPSCDAAIIAVKPQHVEDAVRSAVAAGAHRVLSIAAGVTIARIEAAAGRGVAVIRSMPNTPALVGEGASALSAGAEADDDDVRWASRILGSVGVVVEVPESQLDAVTGLAGSGPAYVFLVAEALMQAGREAGLPGDVVNVLVRQLMVGSAALLAEGDDPEELRRRVTSPGGTTAEGVKVLEARQIRDAFVAAVAAATRRSRELGAS